MNLCTHYHKWQHLLKGASLHVNYLPAVKVRIYTPKDVLSIKNLYTLENIK
jgi:hypothetical protein